MGNIKLGKYEISKKKALAIGLGIVILAAIALNWKAIECAILLLVNSSAYESACVAALS